MIMALSVSCGTRLAPRNSNPSITCPAGGAAVGACRGASSCGCGAGGVAGGCCAAGGFTSSVGTVSKGFFFCSGAAGCAGGCCAGGCCADGCCAGGWAVMGEIQGAQ